MTSQVFWDDDWSRPDKLTSYMTKEYAKDVVNTQDYEKERKEKTIGFNFGMGAIVEGFGASGKLGISKTKIRRSQVPVLS